MCSSDLSIEAQNESLNNWFREVIKNMETVEINRNILYLSNYPVCLDASSLFTSSIKENMNVSWLTQVQVKPEILILQKLKQDPEQERRIKKLEKELFEQKMLVENMKKEMGEMKEEHIAREEALIRSLKAQIRRSEALEETLKKQSE